jgi:Holliday junction resolvasome RuvABC endonuclease subunit
MTLVIGVDPSITSTGVAIVDDNGWRCWHISTDPRFSEVERLSELATDLREIVRQELERPALAIVERGFSGGKGPTAWVNGASAGALIAALTQMCGVATLLVAPKVRAKLATGKGNADKIDVRDAAIARLGYVGKQPDEIDALWLAVAAYELCGFNGERYRNRWRLPAVNLSVLEQYGDEVRRIAYLPPF